MHAIVNGVVPLSQDIIVTLRVASRCRLQLLRGARRYSRVNPPSSLSLDFYSNVNMKQKRGLRSK